jgi:hypothetical protein
MKLPTTFTIQSTYNCHILINQHQLYNIVQQLHITSHNLSKGENTTPYDKHHIQHLATIHISSFNHIKPFTKDL